MADQPDDPAMTAYGAVRAHELMLNEAVSRFEHARLAPLIALNGGSLIAFLTLLGALVGKDSRDRPDLWLAGCAASAWVVGLVSAALAVSSAASGQAAISAAHRLLREGLEDALMDEPVAKLLRGPAPPPPQQPSGPFERARARKSRRERAADTPVAGVWADDRPERERQRAAERTRLRATSRLHDERFRARWWRSVAMFVAGAALALAAIVL